MNIRKPPVQQVVQFITQTHQVEKLDKINQGAVERTLQQKEKNIWAHGHLQAISYVLNKLLPSPDYPTRNPNFNTMPEFESNAFWLKKINSLIQSPLIADNERNYSLTKIGIWRPDLAENVFTPAPTPPLIPFIMFNWLKQLTRIHNNVKNKLDNPHGLTKDEFIEMKNFADDIPAFFSTTQPFKYDNNRMGRFIQNTVLMGWNMPMTTNIQSTYEKFKLDLDNYQKSKLPKIVSNAHNLKKLLS